MLSGSALKVIATLAMFVDHTADCVANVGVSPGTAPL